MRKRIIPEQVFYNHITTLIKNLLINNPNYNNKHFWNLEKHELKYETIERAEYILTEMEKTKHLIFDKKEEEV